MSASARKKRDSAMASHWFNWRQGVIHYTKSGMGQPLVLVHDLHGGASGEEFDRNVNALGSHFTVYRLDLAGFGLSNGRQMRYRARDYVALLIDFVQDVVGMPTHVAAVGASIAFLATAAAEHPSLFKRYIFISPDVSDRRATPWWWAIRLLQEASWLTLITPPFRSIFAEVMAGEWELGEFLRRTVFNQRNIDPSKLDRLQELAREPHAIFAYASLEAGFLSLPLRSALPQIVGSTLFICGREIESEYMTGVEQLAQLVPQARVEWVQKANRWPHYEASRRTNQLIVEFLDRAGLDEDKSLKLAPKSAVFV
jgi:pimeloyl-ACP methyl ester carboxylesterase